MYSVSRISESIYSITDQEQIMVRMYLIVGEQNAVLLDSGLGGAGLPEVLHGITDRPIAVYHTHGDGDHVGGDAFFHEAFISPCEYSYYRKWNPALNGVKLSALWEGSIIHAAPYHFRVISTPGHTPGSLSFWEEEKGLLFPGDSLCAGVIVMTGDDRDLEAYRASIEDQYLPIFDKVTAVYPCHDEACLDRMIIKDCRQAVSRTNQPVTLLDDTYPQFLHGKRALTYHKVAVVID